MSLHVPTLYHISFQEHPEAIWTPMAPAGNADVTKSRYPEPDIPRICCSETLEGCFMAVYPNVSAYFEDPKYKYPHMDFFYYCPVITRIHDKDVLTPEQLTERAYVWDAHVTREWDVLVPVKMLLSGKVRFHNTSKRKDWITTHPFNDSSLPLRDVCPPIEIERLHWVNKPLSAQW